MPEQDAAEDDGANNSDDGDSAHNTDRQIRGNAHLNVAGHQLGHDAHLGQHQKAGGQSAQPGLLGAQQLAGGPAGVVQLGGRGGVVGLELGLGDVIGIEAPLLGGIAQKRHADHTHHGGHAAADHRAHRHADRARQDVEQRDKEHGSKVGAHCHDAHGLSLSLGEPHGHQSTHAHKGAGAEAAAHKAHGD